EREAEPIAILVALRPDPIADLVSARVRPGEDGARAGCRVRAAVRVRHPPHGARRVYRSAMAAEQGTHPRRRREAPRRAAIDGHAAPSRAAVARHAYLRARTHVRRYDRVELYSQLALEAQLRAGLPAAGVQQHDVQRRGPADRR